MINNKLFTNCESIQLFNHLYFLQNEIYNARNQDIIQEIKKILKSRKYHIPLFQKGIIKKQNK